MKLDIVNLLLIGGVLLGVLYLIFPDFFDGLLGSLQAQPAKQQVAQQQSTGATGATLEISGWFIVVAVIGLVLVILTQFVNPIIVIAGVTLVVIILGISVFIYQKEDVKTIQVSGQTSDGSTASVKILITVSRKATGILEFLQLTLFDPRGDDFGDVVVSSVNQTANTAIGQIASDRFLRSAKDISNTVRTLLDANPDVLFRVHRIAVPEVSLPRAMVEALVQQATAVADASTVATTVKTVIDQLRANNIPVTEETVQVAIENLIKARADADRISAAGSSFGGFVEWFLQRVEGIFQGGDNK